MQLIPIRFLLKSPTSTLFLASVHVGSGFVQTEPHYWPTGFCSDDPIRHPAYVVCDIIQQQLSLLKPFFFPKRHQLAKCADGVSATVEPFYALSASIPGGLPMVRGRRPGVVLVPGVGASFLGVGVLDLRLGVDDLSF